MYLNKTNIYPVRFTIKDYWVFFKKSVMVKMFKKTDEKLS